MAQAYIHKGIGYWLTMLLALVILIFGLWLFIGGIWLITLGGSPYYGFAGLLLEAGFDVRSARWHAQKHARKATSAGLTRLASRHASVMAGTS